MAFTIIIPTLNEGKTIGPLLKTLRELYGNVSIIVSDDGSIDATKKMALKHGAIFLDRAHRRHGLCASVLDAITMVSTPYFIVIDGDFQHPPEKIKELVAKLKRSDIVIGKRIEVRGNWPFFRRLMSYGAVMLGRIRLILKPFYVSDVVSGFFAMRSPLAQKLVSRHRRRFVDEGYKVLFDFLKVSGRANISEVDYVFGLRREGASKIQTKHIYYYLKSLIT